MNNKNKHDDEPELPIKLEFEAMDTSGVWFAAAVLFAALGRHDQLPRRQ